MVHIDLWVWGQKYKAFGRHIEYVFMVLVRLWKFLSRMQKAAGQLLNWISLIFQLWWWHMPIIPAFRRQRPSISTYVRTPKMHWSWWIRSLNLFAYLSIVATFSKSPFSAFHHYFPVWLADWGLVAEPYLLGCQGPSSGPNPPWENQVWKWRGWMLFPTWDLRCHVLDLLLNLPSR